MFNSEFLLANQGNRHGDVAEGEDEGAEEVGVHSGADDEFSDVGFADFEVSDEAREDRGGGGREEDGEAESEVEFVDAGEEVEERRDGAAEDEGGEDAGVGDLGGA